MERGVFVVYKPHGSVAVWGVEFVIALEAIGSICGCDVHWQPHAVHQPGDALILELIAATAPALGKVVVSPHLDVARLEPHKYCWALVKIWGCTRLVRRF